MLLISSKQCQYLPTNLKASAVIEFRDVVTVKYPLEGSSAECNAAFRKWIWEQENDEDSVPKIKPFNVKILWYLRDALAEAFGLNELGLSIRWGQNLLGKFRGPTCPFQI